MPHACARPPATQRSSFPRGQACLLAALIAGGLTGAPALAAAPSLLLTQASAADSRADPRPAMQLKQPRLHGRLSGIERDGLPSMPLTEDIMYRVLASEISLQREWIEPAYDTYLDLARDTRDPRFAQRATEIALLADSAPRALAAARQWAKLSPASRSARQAQQQLLVSMGHWSEAEPALQAQLHKAPPGQRAEAILQLQRQLALSADPAGAAQALRRIVAHDLQRPEAHLALARASMAAKDPADALSELDTALKLRPHYEEAAILAAELRAEHDPDTAIAGLRTLLKAAPASIDARLTLARIYLTRNQDDNARAEFETLRKIAPGNPRMTLMLGLLSLQQNRRDTAERYLTEYIEQAAGSPALNPDLGYQGLAQLAEAKKDYARAIAWLDEIARTADNGNDDRIMLAIGIKRAQLLGKMGRVDEARQAFGMLIADTENVFDELGRQSLADGIRQAEVGMLIDARAYGPARDRVNALLKRDPGNAEYSYQLAMLEERDGHYDNMEALLRKVIDLRPDQAIGYNALGYSLADRNLRLQEALELLEKATMLAPDDPYIADSLGWVQYRRGDLPAAAGILEKAWAAAPQAEIGAHLGEVLWQSGRQDDARGIWMQAARLDIDDPTLRETLRRFGQSAPPASPGADRLP